MGKVMLPYKTETAYTLQGGGGAGQGITFHIV
jgi:hypothetical protein